MSRRYFFPCPGFRQAWLWVALCACGGPAVGASSQTLSAREHPIDRVVIVSVDGLRSADCAKLPTLGKLARAGAFAAPPEGALTVMPSVTYPSHTTMVTGMLPKHHGITTNIAPDPTHDGKNDAGWRWYREDVRTPTLYDLALAAGQRTVLLQWPVTVGARATALIPEFWRAHTQEDIKLLRPLSTPGLFDALAARVPEFYQRFTPGKMSDAWVIDVALALLASEQPNLMLLHLAETDSAQHEHGPDSEQADVARLSADAQVARLLEALRASKMWGRTVLVVVSDHGFLPVSKVVYPNFALAERGLNKRVWVLAGGGFAYFYLQRADDLEAAASARAVLTELAADRSHGIGTLLDRTDIEARGGDPEAFMALEALPGFMVSAGRGSALVSDTKTKGNHGFLPERPEMRASLLFYGPRVQPGTLRGARLVDLAPTVAPWLGLSIPNPDGRPLSVVLSPTADSGR